MCGCKKNCYPMTGCYMNITSQDIAPLQYYYGVTADGCWKFQTPPPTQSAPNYLDCAGGVINPAIDRIAKCTEVDAKIVTAINALRLAGCDNVSVPLNTPMVKCAELPSAICNILGAYASQSFVYGSTEFVTANCGKASIPPITSSITLAGNVLTLVVNGATSQAVLPSDVQVAGVALVGNTLTVTETNGDVNAVDISPVLNTLKKCGGANINFAVDELVACSQFQALLNSLTTNAISIAGGILTTTVNGQVASVALPTDVQVTNANLSGSSLIIAETNGDVNTVDLADILNGIPTCDGTLFNRLTDRLVKCSQFSSLVTNDLSIVGNVLTSTVNGQSDSINLPVPTIPTELAITRNAPLTGNGLASSPLDIDFLALSAQDKCDFGNGITNTATLASILGKDALGCLSQYVIDCVCDEDAPYSTYGISCVNGQLGKAQYRERLSSVTI